MDSFAIAPVDAELVGFRFINRDDCGEGDDPHSATFPSSFLGDGHTYYVVFAANVFRQIGNGLCTKLL